MRLIDADKLRDALQNEIDKAIPPYNDAVGAIRCGVRLARNILEDAPTIDAVPVNWIEDYLEQIHEDLDYARQDNDEEAMKRIFWKYETIRWMVADWRHDEKTR